MKAITREEKIIQGENLTPITRKEMFLAKLVGKEIETPHPITRAEKIMSGEQLSPITREEMFLAKAVGQGIEVPTPITRKEIFLNDVSFEEPTYHTIRFISEGVVLQESILAYGEIPVYVGEEPTKTDYKFVGWVPEIAAVTGDVDYVAQFKYTKSILRSIMNYKLKQYSSDAVTKVGDGAFYGNGNLGSISLPNAKTIGKEAMYNDYSLTSVNMPSLETIGQRAFIMCSRITSIDLPVVKSISDDAFNSCGRLASVRLPATPPALSNANAFNGIKSDCVFYIPTGSLAAYQSATNWSSLTSKYSFVEEDR